jgi:hypothetical protein
MEQTRFDQPLQGLARFAGRRDAVRSLGAMATALLAALGHRKASAADKPRKHLGGKGGGANLKDRRQNRIRTRNRRRGNADQTSPRARSGAETQRESAEADDPTEIAARLPFATKYVFSAPSPPLPVASGSHVDGLADCGGRGRVVSCGYELFGTTPQLANAIVIGVGTDADRRLCVAHLFRVVSVGSSPGALIHATAVCLV